MDTIVDKYLSVREATGRYRRPNFPKDLKRRLAEQTFESGASVALIARQNDINANLLFKWRQHYLDGDYGLPTVGAQAGASAYSSLPPSSPTRRRLHRQSGPRCPHLSLRSNRAGAQALIVKSTSVTRA